LTSRDRTDLPSGLTHLRASPEGRAWLERLPVLLERCRRRWDLTLGEPYPGSQESVAIPAVRDDGEAAVLKVRFLGRENEHEPDALAAWGGDGAVRLLERDEDVHALLIERCEPGSPLAQLGMEAALDVLIDLLPRLWIPAAEPFRTLADEAAWWAGYVVNVFERSGRPFARRVLDIVVDTCVQLPGSTEEHVLLHQDLHGDNVLAAKRRPWLVIDPKPLIGERAFSVAPIVRSFELGATEHAVRRRLDRLTSELSLDRDRALRWTIAQTVAWAFDDGRAFPWHIAVAEWLARDL
jgi:streptomycin 6-kinase